MRAAGLGLAMLVLLAGLAQPWGNGASSSPTFPYYGVHDAIAHLAYEKLRGAHPDAADFIAHWFRAAPGGYGASFVAQNLAPTATDNFLGYTDEPDSVFQDWCNHLYMVHPRPGADERCAPAQAEELMGRLSLNLTAWVATARVPCAPPSHAAAYHAGLLAHYVADLSQWGHTDDTRKDHSHPADDPDDRTYHGYYESQTWGAQGLQALLADQRARPYTPARVADVQAAVVGLAERVNMPDGVTVTYTDVGGGVVQVGSQYRTMLTTYVQAYDAGQRHLGLRGMTPALWALTTANVDQGVRLLADLYYTAWQDATLDLPVLPPAVPVGPPGCPPA